MFGTVIAFCLAICSILNCNGSTQSLPTIDLADSQEKSSKILFEAATKYGFFNIINHGIATATTQQVLQSAKELFNLDLNDKLHLPYDDTHWGYIPYMNEATDPNQQKGGDMKEGFYIHNKIGKRNNTTTVKSFTDSDHNQVSHRQNRWPDESKLPKFRPVINKYMGDLNSLAMKITELIALSLNLSSNYFKQPGTIQIS